MATEDSRKLVDCEYFLKGICNKGESCPFRHSEEAKASGRDCKYWLQGTCTNLLCKYIHHAWPTKPVKPILTPEQRANTVCIFFVNGACAKGAACPFSHDLNLIQKKVASSQANNTTDKTEDTQRKHSKNDPRILAKQAAQERQLETTKKPSILSRISSVDNNKSKQQDLNQRGKTNKPSKDSTKRSRNADMDEAIRKQVEELNRNSDLRARMRRFGLPLPVPDSNGEGESTAEQTQVKSAKRERPPDTEEDTEIDTDHAKRRRLAESENIDTSELAIDITDNAQDAAAPTAAPDEEDIDVV